MESIELRHRAAQWIRGYRETEQGQAVWPTTYDAARMFLDMAGRIAARELFEGGIEAAQRWATYFNYTERYMNVVRFMRAEAMRNA